MKKYALHLLLILSVPVWLMFAASAQESGASGTNGDTSAAERRDSGKEDAASEKAVAPSDRDGSTAPAGDTDAAKKKAARQAGKKKKTERKTAPAEGEAPKETEQETAPDDGTGENLLLVDHERIKYDRIPGITIKAEDSGQESIVNVPDDKISGQEKKKKEGEGIFGKNTRAIAGWGIVILIFILFVIYSKTRSRKSKRRVVRTVPKR
jgi:hypothetical protein